MPEGLSSQLPMILLMAALIGLMWWSMRRQKRTQAEAQSMRDGLVPGTKVMTGSGFFGTIDRIEGDRVFLRNETGQVSEWLMPAIQKVDTPVVIDAAVPDDASALDGYATDAAPESEVRPDDAPDEPTR